LLDHFGTVRAAITASEEELCRIKGIHHVTAAKIEWVLGTGSHGPVPDQMSKDINLGQEPP
jgi:ERCC4-type nuclease